MNAQAPILIYRITHIANVPWILANGLHAASSPTSDPNFVAIGNADLIGKRRARVVPIPPGGVLDDYVPLYFGTHSAMLYNIHTGYGGIPQQPQRDIVYLVSSIQRLQASGLGFVFTDRHAYVANARYFSNVSDLQHLDWALIRGRDFKRDANRLDKLERRPAELLVHGHLPVGALSGIACFDAAATAQVNGYIVARNLPLVARALPQWYF